MMRFRVVIAGLAGLIAVYVVFWLIAAQNTRDRIAEWIEVQKAAGNAITYSTLGVSGFPYRIEVTAADLLVRGEEEGLQWALRSPVAIAVALPWKKQHVILFAESAALDLALPSGAVETLKTHNLRASVIIGADETPRRVAVTAEGLTAENAGPENSGAAVVLSMKKPELHWRIGADVAAVAGEANDEVREPMMWQFAFEAVNITHPAFASSPYGAVMNEFKVLIELRGSGIGAETTPNTVAAWRDQGGTVEVTALNLLWGALDLRLAGSLTLDQEFRPLGAFSADVKGYEPIIDHLQASGQIDKAEADTARATLAAIVASDTDNNGRLNVPLTFQGGRMFIGPLPVADLPPLLAPASVLPNNMPPAPGGEPSV